MDDNIDNQEHGEIATYVTGLNLGARPIAPRPGTPVAWGGVLHVPTAQGCVRTAATVTYRQRMAALLALLARWLWKRS